jgi:hypothetical protein
VSPPAIEMPDANRAIGKVSHDGLCGNCRSGYGSEGSCGSAGCCSEVDGRFLCRENGNRRERLCIQSCPGQAHVCYGRCEQRIPKREVGDVDWTTHCAARSGTAEILRSPTRSAIYKTVRVSEIYLSLTAASSSRFYKNPRENHLKEK